MTTPKTKSPTKFEKLCAGILANSSDSTINFSKARDEWEFLFVTKNSQGQCLCGKEIQNECHIQNQINKKRLVVGSDCLTRVCVKGNYINEVTNLFSAINIFIKDKKLERLLINYCKDKGILNDWEYEFCLNTHSKRKLSDKQLEKKEVINTKILSKLSITSILDPGKINEVRQTTKTLSASLPPIPTPILKKK